MLQKNTYFLFFIILAMITISGCVSNNTDNIDSLNQKIQELDNKIQDLETKYEEIKSPETKELYSEAIIYRNTENKTTTILFRHTGFQFEVNLILPDFINFRESVNSNGIDMYYDDGTESEDLIAFGIFPNLPEYTDMGEIVYTFPEGKTVLVAIPLDIGKLSNDAGNKLNKEYFELNPKFTYTNIHIK